MIKASELAQLLNVSLHYFVAVYFRPSNLRSYSIFADAPVPYPQAIGIINSEGNRVNGTPQAKALQNKLRQGLVVCNSQGQLEVR